MKICLDAYGKKELKILFKNLNISKNTEDLIAELQVYSNRKLNNPDALKFLIELCSISQKELLLDNILFTAKYLNGLGKILQSNITLNLKNNSGENGDPQPTAEQAMEKIKGEYKVNIIKFTNYLKDIILDANEEEKILFEEKYLALTRTSMVNLTSLIYDLSWLKRYNNSKR
jgi:hypothetical protein